MLGDFKKNRDYQQKMDNIGQINHLNFDINITP